MKRAVIFDLDGVLLSTDHLHYQAWKMLADRLGIPFTRRQGDRCRGISRMESLEIMLEGSAKQYTSQEKELLAQEKNQYYRESLVAMTVGDVPEESVRVLQELRSRGYKLALASASKNAGLILERTGLGRMLDAVADGTMTTHSKPDPEVFLKAASLLSVAPQDCVGVDDAVAGIQAVRAAGMPAAAIGPAAQAGLGDWNLQTLDQLLELCPDLPGGTGL